MRSFFIASYSKNIIHGFIFFLVSLTSCDDHLKDVGMEVIDRGTSTGTFKTDTLYTDDIERIASFMDSVPTSVSRHLYLGSVDSYDFRMLMRFSFLSDEIIDPSGDILPLDSLKIQAARIKLVSSKSYGPSGVITARVKTIQSGWATKDLFWNRFLEGVNYNANSIGSATFSNLADKASLVIQLPKDTIIHWIKARNDTSTANPIMNNGIIIESDPGAAFVQQFYSGNNTTFINGSITLDSNLVPRLEVDYTYAIDKDKDGDIDQFDKVYSSKFYISPVFINSVYNGGYHGYVYRDRSIQPLNSISVGGGLPYHTMLRFKTDKLPRNITVNSAVLLMKTDNSGNYFRSTGDSINIQAVAASSDTSLWKPGSVVLINDFSRFDNIRDDTLKLEISGFVQNWAYNPSSNNGFMLMNYAINLGNFNPLYRVRFYNNPADRNNSPKIIIYYTQSPQ